MVSTRRGAALDMVLRAAVETYLDHYQGIGVDREQAAADILLAMLRACALPCMPPDSVRALRDLADDVIDDTDPDLPALERTDT